MNKNFRLIFLIPALLIQLACGSTGERKTLESLTDAIDNYAYALRWGRIDDAVAFHVNEDGTRPDIDVSIMKFIRVTGFNIKERILNPEHTEATVESELNYYNDQYATLRTTEYTQTWWYQSDSKKWYLSSEFPVFK